MHADGEPEAQLMQLLRKLRGILLGDSGCFRISRHMIIYTFLKMGTTQNASSNIGITKGFGYRVISIQPNSPAAPLLEQYFDFIVDAIPQKQPDRSPKDILSKLTNEAAETRSKPSQSLASVLASCEDQPLTLRVVSTKYRKVRNVEIVPSRSWNEEGDLLGAELRL